MSNLTHLSLFSGIGGLDLAAEWAGFETAGQCEWADYQTKVLEKHWPNVPRWRDIRTLTTESFYAKTGLRTVDIISGGFPCQPFSTAGKRRGKEDDRYLWPEMLRVIQEIRPSWVLGENVAGIVNMALDQVLSDLEAINYSCQAFIIPACAVDAPHRRDRCAIVAYSNGRKCMDGRSNIHTAKTREPSQLDPCGCCETMADTDGKRSRPFRPELPLREREPAPIGVSCHVPDPDDWGGLMRRNGKLQSAEKTGSRGADNRGGAPEYGGGERWAVEPDVGRVANGIPNRVDRLRCLGNAVVPYQFYPIFKIIAELQAERKEIK